MRAKDAFWASAANWSQQLFAFLTMLVVARLLDPAVFGVIATAMLLVLALQRVLLESIGFAVIQQTEITDRYLSTAFWTSALFGALLSGLLVLTAPWLALSFKNPDLEKPLQVLALLVFFDAFATIPLGLLRREFKFKSLAIRTFFANVLSGIVGISLAFAGAGIWSLVAQQVVASLGSLVGLWFYSNWRPKWFFSWLELKRLAIFGTPMVGSALFLVIINRMDILLLSAAAGATATGLYSLAKRIVRTVTDVIISGLVNVSLSSFSKLKDQPDERDRFLGEKINQTALIAYPLFITLAITSPLLVPMVLGEKWLDAIPLIQYLCLFGVLQLPILFGNNVLISVGYSRHLFIMNAFATGLLFCLIAYGLRWGASGVAIAFVLQGLFTLLVQAFVLKLFLKIHFKNTLISSLKAILLASVMGGLLMLMLSMVSGWGTWYLLILIPVYSIVLLLSLYSFDGFWRSKIEIILKKFQVAVGGS